jgi:hypothetical protein
MPGPADASLHEPHSGTCSISPTHIDCRKAEPGGSATQHQRPRRSTNIPAYERRQPYGRRHRTARVWTRISSIIPFYGWFGTEARISFALACPRFNRRRPPRGLGAVRFATLSASRALGFDPPPGRDIRRASRSCPWRDARLQGEPHRGRRSANAVSQRRRRAGNSFAVMLWPPTVPAGGTGVLGRRNLGCTRVRMIKQRTLYTEGQWSRAWIATRDGSGY